MKSSISKALILLCIAILFLSIFQNTALADSPITSTQFYHVYSDIEIVNKASELSGINEEIAEYLSDASNPIDVKAAVINAMSWGSSDKSNTYCNIVYGMDIRDMDFDKISAEEAFCIGYMMAMDDYFNPQNALPVIERASSKITDSLSVPLITAIIKSQIALDDGNWGLVWVYTDMVLNDNSLKQDMRQEAVDAIVEYLILYKGYICIQPNLIYVEEGKTSTAKIYGGEAPYSISEPYIVKSRGDIIAYSGPPLPESEYYSEDAQVMLELESDELICKGIKPGVVIIQIDDRNDRNVTFAICIQRDKNLDNNTSVISVEQDDSNNDNKSKDHMTDEPYENRNEAAFTLFFSPGKEAGLVDLEDSSQDNNYQSNNKPMIWGLIIAYFIVLLLILLFFR